MTFLYAVLRRNLCTWAARLPGDAHLSARGTHACALRVSPRWRRLCSRHIALECSRVDRMRKGEIVCLCMVLAWRTRLCLILRRRTGRIPIGHLASIIKARGLPIICPVPWCNGPRTPASSLPPAGKVLCTFRVQWAFLCYLCIFFCADAWPSPSQAFIWLSTIIRICGRFDVL